MKYSFTMKNLNFLLKQNVLMGIFYFQIIEKIDPKIPSQKSFSVNKLMNR